MTEQNIVIIIISIITIHPLYHLSISVMGKLEPISADSAEAGFTGLTQRQTASPPHIHTYGLFRVTS